MACGGCPNLWDVQCQRPCVRLATDEVSVLGQMCNFCMGEEKGWGPVGPKETKKIKSLISQIINFQVVSWGGGEELATDLKE